MSDDIAADLRRAAEVHRNVVSAVIPPFAPGRQDGIRLAHRIDRFADDWPTIAAVLDAAPLDDLDFVVLMLRSGVENIALLRVADRIEVHADAVRAYREAPEGERT